MAIDRPIGFTPNPPPGFPQEQEKAIQQMVEMQVEDGTRPDIELLEDGSAIVGEQERPIETSFDMNLAEVLEDAQLGRISNELQEAFEDDKASRQDWEDTYKKGLDLLGFKYQERTMPFAASNISISSGVYTIPPSFL